jgi:hypothetical protein
MHLPGPGFAADNTDMSVIRVLPAVAFAFLAACASREPVPATPRMSAADGRALVAKLLPANLADRAGWSTDIYAALATLGIDPNARNICSVIAVTAQESGFDADPSIPNLPAIAWKEIEQQRERAGIPRLVLQGALAIPSSNGKSYSERIDAAKTEQELSDIYEDMIGRVPLAKGFLADRNPVRTGGPMQVSITFAQAHAKAKPYPYPVVDSIRHEVFTRRGGMYFGIAHLLDYPASYTDPLYRFADFNAGRYASRNAAFQKAVTLVSGIPLELDGDLVRYDRGKVADAPGNTEVAVRTLASRLDLSPDRIRRELELGRDPEFEKTRLYVRLFELADRANGKPVPRAVVPTISLRGAKITRKLTTDWFATRVATRYKACLGRA